VLIKEQFDALLLEVIFIGINEVPLDPLLHLVNLPHEALLPILRHRGDGGPRPSIELAYGVSVLSPHHLQRFEDGGIIVVIREAPHGQVVLVHLVVLLLLALAFDLIQDALYNPHCDLGLGHIGPVQTVQAVGSEHSFLLLNHLPSVSVLHKVHKLVDQHRLNFNHQIIQFLKVISLSLRMEIEVRILH